MIVKDEEANLAACLDSARGLFDETVVVDTGSADRTVKVARSFGARVFRFAWCDDFSAARNFSLDQVRTDYVFRLDADDRIPAGQHKRLRATPGLAPPRPPGGDCLPRRGRGESRHAFDRQRRDPALAEYSRPPFRRPGPRADRVVTAAGGRFEPPGRCAARPPRLHRRRDRPPQARAQRAADPARSGRAPDDATCLFELGRCKSMLGDPRGALDALVRSLDRMPVEWDLYARVAFRLVAQLHHELGDSRRGARGLPAGLARYPDDASLAAQEADLLSIAGHLDQAAAAYRKVLALGAPGRIEAGVEPQFRARVAAALAEVEARRRRDENR